MTVLTTSKYTFSSNW